jgi:uncharacterized membrane protein YdbT with pleckstrin-like domain
VGAYVNSNLGSNERIVYEGKVSWMGQAGLFIWGLIFLGFFGIGLLFWVAAAIRVYTTELAITDKRIIAKFGLISRSTVELRLEKVESVQVDQSILGRMFNYGTIVVAGAGAPKAPIPGISSPLEFRSRLNAVLEEKTEPKLTHKEAA